ncbi:hypothetical protein CHELA20_50597 [Hyphomicrobiales bacterium]|nr:hypothetical protein CHELA20_50597 [Hyphomicrobiales bacterium]CAH1678391.1 hypothetical protein CHELA41_24529 [Hyphomicrobiales bacterium]
MGRRDTRYGRQAGPDLSHRLRALITASFTPPGCIQETMAVRVTFAGTAGWSPPLAALYRACD